MSDLSSTNCGCNNGFGGPLSNAFGNGNNCLWLIILLFLCGGSCSNQKNGCGNGLLGNMGGDCVEWIIIILLLTNCCGNSKNNCGCKSSCC